MFIALAVLIATIAAAPPLYPNAEPGKRPADVGMRTPPRTVKAYSTRDGFEKVKAWYRTHLPHADEMAQPGRAKTEDAFLMGHGASATVIMIQRYGGKTWILIGPPF